MIPLLEVRDVSVRHGKALAVEGVSFDLATGEALAILGRNGAGKSSLLNAIAGLYGRTGHVGLGGKVLPPEQPRQAVRSGLAIVLERRELFPGMTVDDNLRVAAFGCGIRTLRKMRQLGNFDAVYTYFPDLADKRRQLAGSLSGGQQQMLAIGRALVTSPKLLLLDEPSLGLAPKMVSLVFDALGQLRATGMSIIVVEENPRRALQVVDRAMVMGHGSIDFMGSAAEINSSPEVLRASYFGQRAQGTAASQASLSLAPDVA